MVPLKCAKYNDYQNKTIGYEVANYA